MKHLRAILVLLTLLPHLAGADAFRGWLAERRCPMECCASVVSEPASCCCIEASDASSAPSPALPNAPQRDSQLQIAFFPPASSSVIDALHLPPQVIEAAKGLVSPHHRPSVRLSVLLCSLLN